MAIVSRGSFIDMSRYLRLEINHAVSGMQVCRGRNIHEENRIFAIRDSGKLGGYIYNHDTRQKMPMKAGNIYFMPTNADLEYEFTKDLYFSAIHFSIRFFNGFDLFANVQDFAVISDTENFNGRLQGAIEDEPSLQNVSILHLGGKGC